jgi:hypothetical protein
MDEHAEFQLWPDAARGGVNFAWADPPHADENCGDPGLLDAATLRRYGAATTLAQAFGRRRVTPTSRVKR